MKDNKRIKSFNEHQEKLSLSNVIESQNYENPVFKNDDELVDELNDVVIKHLNDWKNGKYNRENKYVRNLVTELMKIDVLFSRDIDSL